MQKENGTKISDSDSDSGKSHNRRAKSAAPLRNQPPLTSHTGFPSPLDATCNASPVKADSEIPSVSPLGSVPHLTGGSLRQDSFGKLR
jgi:hypothetical protein